MNDGYLQGGVDVACNVITAVVGLVALRPVPLVFNHAEDPTGPPLQKGNELQANETRTFIGTTKRAIWMLTTLPSSTNDIELRNVR